MLEWRLLEGLAQLRSLASGKTKFTDTGLVYLQGLIQLQKLNLAGTKITDAGLAKKKT